MARERTTRQPAGPGRSVKRPRTPKSAASANEPLTMAARSKIAVRKLGPRIRDIGFTRRALVLVGVLSLLALSYANSLRIMLNQQRDLAAADVQIAQRTSQLGDLDAQLERWRDPAYVKAQARAQLGWVMPGEVGYRVIGADGKVIEDDARHGALAVAADEEATRWWDRLVGSIQAADAQPR